MNDGNKMRIDTYKRKILQKEMLRKARSNSLEKSTKRLISDTIKYYKSKQEKAQSYRLKKKEFPHNINPERNIAASMNLNKSPISNLFLSHRAVKKNPEAKKQMRTNYQAMNLSGSFYFKPEKRSKKIDEIIKLEPNEERKILPILQRLLNKKQDFSEMQFRRNAKIRMIQIDKAANIKRMIVQREEEALKVLDCIVPSCYLLPDNPKIGGQKLKQTALGRRKLSFPLQLLSKPDALAPLSSRYPKKKSTSKTPTYKVKVYDPDIPIFFPNDTSDRRRSIYQNKHSILSKQFSSSILDSKTSSPKRPKIGRKLRRKRTIEGTLSAWKADLQVTQDFSSIDGQY